MNYLKSKSFWRENTGSSKITVFIFIALVVVALGVVGGGLYWKFVVNRTVKAAELTPEKTELFLKLEWREDSIQNNNLSIVSENLGGSTTVDNILARFVGKTYANSAVNFRNDLAPWLGEEVAIARKTTANADQQITLFSVANTASRDSFLAKLEKEATNVAPEVYKNISVKTLTGKTPLSYAIVSNFVVIAPKVQLVKEVIDVSNGTTKALSKVDAYKLIARNLNQPAIFSGFIDVAPIIRSNSGLLVGTDIKLDANSTARMGIAVVAEQTGFALKAFLPKVGGNDSIENKFNPEILGLLPNDIVGYLGGTDLSDFMRQYLTTLLGIPKIFSENLTTSTVEKKYGINLETELYSWLKGEYVVSYVNAKSNDFSLVVRVDNPKDVAQKMRNIEKVVSGLLSENATEPQFKNVSFQEGKTGDTSVRYLALPGAGAHYLNYAIKGNYVVLATSRNALDDILDSAQGKSSFLKSKTYELVTGALPKDGLSGTLYIDRGFLLQILTLAGYDFTSFQKHFVGMDFVSVENKDGTLISGFLPVL